jgi:hypothetical protein
MRLPASPRLLERQGRHNPLADYELGFADGPEPDALERLGDVVARVVRGLE